MNEQVLSVGRVTPNGVELLGTACMINSCGLFVTCAHVVKNDDTKLVLLMNGIKENGYQDTTDNNVRYTNVKVREMNPFADVCILELEKLCSNNEPTIGIEGTDEVQVGEEVVIWGFPHSDHGRKVLTMQKTEVGAKILIDANGITTKHIVLNIQCKPGQSGSPVIRLRDGSLVGVIIGSYAPPAKGGISLGGIDPQTLHQTTHAVSAEYVKEMLK